MRKQRVALEHGVDRSLVRRQRRDVVAIEQDFAVVGKIEAGDQPQQRRLTATGRPEQGEELVFTDRDRDIIERRHLGVAGSEQFGDPARLDGGPAG
jgi:hypothetical protein